MSRKSRKRANRRDRRKAKASKFAREGTKNPKKIGHHSYCGLGTKIARKIEIVEKPRENMVKSISQWSSGHKPFSDLVLKDLF